METKEIQSKKKYNLEERCEDFACSVAGVVKKLPKTIENIEYGKQDIRSSGSIGANYIEANECLSKKDFLFRIKICRKESRETEYWLRIIGRVNLITGFIEPITKESNEFKLIFSSMIEKSTRNTWK